MPFAFMLWCSLLRGIDPAVGTFDQRFDPVVLANFDLVFLLQSHAIVLVVAAGMYMLVEDGVVFCVSLAKMWSQFQLPLL